MQVRWLRRVIAPRQWEQVAQRVGKVLGARAGEEEEWEVAGGFGGGLSYLEIDLAATWLAPQVLTYADVCCRMLTYAIYAGGVILRLTSLPPGLRRRCQSRCAHTLTCPDVC